MQSTDSERLYTALRDEEIRIQSQCSMLDTMNRVGPQIAERIALFVSLNKYKVWKEKTVAESIRAAFYYQGNYAVCEAAGNEAMVVSTRVINILQKTNEELMAIYSEDKTVARWRI